MNDRDLSRMLAELDRELGRQPGRDAAAREILEHVETRVPGAVQQASARIDLRRLLWPGASGPR